MEKSYGKKHLYSHLESKLFLDLAASLAMHVPCRNPLSLLLLVGLGQGELGVVCVNSVLR